MGGALPANLIDGRSFFRQICLQIRTCGGDDDEEEEEEEEEKKEEKKE